jgi:hypothetical protein
MESNELKKLIQEQVFSEWRKQTDAIVHYDQNDNRYLNNFRRTLLTGYLQAAKDMALKIDEDLYDDLCFLDRVLIYFDSPTPLPTSQAADHA